MIRQPRLTVSLTAIVLVGGLALVTTGCSAQSSPQPTSAAVSAVAVGSVTSDGTTILAMTSLGDDVFVLGQHDSEIRSAASFNGSSTDLNWETFGEPTTVESTAFTVVNPGNFPDAAPKGIATVTGQVGSDVTGIDVVTGDGPNCPTTSTGDLTRPSISTQRAA